MYTFCCSRDTRIVVYALQTRYLSRVLIHEFFGCFCYGVCFSFMKSTRGDFTYIKAQFLVDCKSKGELLDINSQIVSTDGQSSTPKYVMHLNQSLCVKNRMSNTTRFMQRQRSNVNLSWPLATTAVGRKRRGPRPVESRREYIRKYMRMYREKRKMRNLSRHTDLSGRPITKRRRQYNKFMRKFYREQTSNVENLNGLFAFKFDPSHTKPLLLDAWKLHQLRIRGRCQLKKLKCNTENCAQQKLKAAKRRLSMRLSMR